MFLSLFAKQCYIISITSFKRKIGKYTSFLFLSFWFWRSMIIELVVMVKLRMNEFEQFLSFERCVGIILILVASIGIIGNLFTILFRPKNSSRAGNLVFSLAIFDVVFLICAFLLFGIPLISENYKKHHRKNILPFT